MSPGPDNTYFPARMQSRLGSMKTSEGGIYRLRGHKPTPEAGRTPRCLRRRLSSPRRTWGPCTVTGQDEGARVKLPPHLGPCPPLYRPSTVMRSARAFQGPSLHLPVTLRGPRPSTFAPHCQALSGRGGASPRPSAPASHRGSFMTGGGPGRGRALLSITILHNQPGDISGLILANRRKANGFNNELLKGFFFFCRTVSPTAYKAQST